MVIRNAGDVGHAVAANICGSDSRWESNIIRPAPTPVFNRLGGVVQRILHSGGRHHVFGRLQHLEHVGLGVVRSDVWTLHVTAVFVGVLHAIEAAVDALQEENKIIRTRICPNLQQQWAFNSKEFGGRQIFLSFLFEHASLHSTILLPFCPSLQVEEALILPRELVSVSGQLQLMERST